MEFWKEIKGYEGLYEVSSEGRVKSLGRKPGIMRPGLSNGYLKVGLTKDGIRSRFRVHRLVAEAFIPNPDNKPEVDHINGDRKDNRVENLRWMTHQENNNNPVTLQRRSEVSKGNQACLGKHWTMINNKRVYY
jgi:hypothetical protein